MRFRNLLGALFTAIVLSIALYSCDHDPQSRGVIDETETLISGVITDSTGLAVPACTVWIHPLISQQSAQASLKKEPLSPESIFIITDNLGRFTFKNALPNTPYALVARSIQLKQGVQKKFSLSNNDTLDLVDSLQMSALVQLQYQADTAKQISSVFILELNQSFPLTSNQLILNNVPQGSYTIIPLEDPTHTTLLSTKMSSSTLSSSSSVLSSSSSQDSHVWNGTIGYLTDSRDNMIYHTIIIGSLYWMSGNLNYNTQNASCNPVDSYPTTCQVYGRYYTFNDMQNACPDSWRIPTSTEWMTAIQLTGGFVAAGTHLKSTATWNTSNNLNTYGFNAIAAGSADSTALGRYAWFWTSTQESGTTKAAVVHLADTTAAAYIFQKDTTMGYSVRCVKDAL